ncbi:hypothetical protein [Vibrio cincinnatiensis]|uniref:hypothetical protein n=1 Tax=Vibrio cincinnatiensis TaxID=675 RepID=UPI001EDC9532|nr:hypothetical protein [Vibrio cincinnatiensis]MCG3729767.1 hypothetical protein [Vibrio cincinnatiensis]
MHSTFFRITWIWVTLSALLVSGFAASAPSHSTLHDHHAPPMAQTHCAESSHLTHSQPPMHHAPSDTEDCRSLANDNCCPSMCINVPIILNQRVLSATDAPSTHYQITLVSGDVIHHTQTLFRPPIA